MTAFNQYPPPPTLPLTGSEQLMLAQTNAGVSGTYTVTLAQLLAGGWGFSSDSFVYAGSSGVLASTAAATNGQLLIGSTGAAPVAATLTGTANQVVVTNGAGSITLSLPQNIHTGASPTFAGLTLTGALTSGSASALSLATSGGTQFAVTNTASAVNYVSATGAATGGRPTLSAAGSDTNVPLVLSSKGGGGVSIQDNNVFASSFAAQANAVNRFTFTATATGVAPAFDVVGSDTNVGFRINTKGTGDFSVAVNGSVVLDVTTTGLNSTAIGHDTPSTGAFTALTNGDATALVKSSVALNNGAGSSTATLTNAPAASNPTKWIPINDSGTTRYIPAW